jgi:hypothetical protein
MASLSMAKQQARSPKDAFGSRETETVPSR